VATSGREVYLDVQNVTTTRTEEIVYNTN